jgi:hypothetical protein
VEELTACRRGRLRGPLDSSADRACRRRPHGYRLTLPSLRADLGEARLRRHESQVAIRKGLLRSPSQTTLKEASTEWLAAASPDSCEPRCVARLTL